MGDITMDQLPKNRSVAIVGAGIFGVSLAIALQKRGHTVTVFDRSSYHENEYCPEEGEQVQAASVDLNKIFRASYGKKLHYQRLAMESREAWIKLNEEANDPLFVESGMLRIQPTDVLDTLEKETLANMERDGFRDTQFVKSSSADRARAETRGWKGKLLDFAMPDEKEGTTFEAVLDSLGGLTRCSDACAYYRKFAAKSGVTFHLGPEKGAFESLVQEQSKVDSSRNKAIGLITKDGAVHQADVIVIAAGSFSTQLLPQLSYHLESSAGSLVTFKIDPANATLWDKYSPEKFPVITWRNAARNRNGKDMGSVYVFPRNSDGLIKIGYRGKKFTNFQKAPQGVAFTQDGMWSVPMPYDQCQTVQEPAREAIRHFVSIFLPEFADVGFYSTKMCWYTDSLDNSFIIDYVPDFAENSVFVCTGGSGHGAKFMPVLGEHAADIFDNLDDAKSHMRQHWRWREDIPRRNGLEEGPGGPRNIGRRSIH